MRSSRYPTTASVNLFELVFRFVTKKDSLLHQVDLFFISSELLIALTALGL